MQHEVWLRGATVTYQTQGDDAGDRTYELRVGASDPVDKSYTVISSESPFYVKVAEFAIRELVETERSGLLEMPETPTPMSGATPQG